MPLLVFLLIMLSSNVRQYKNRLVTILSHNRHNRSRTIDTPTLCIPSTNSTIDDDCLCRMLVYLQSANHVQRVRPIVWIQDDHGHVLMFSQFHINDNLWRDRLYWRGLTGLIYKNNTVSIYRPQRVYKDTEQRLYQDTFNTHHLPRIPEYIPECHSTERHKHLVMIVPWMERGGADEYDLAVLANNWYNVTIVTERQDTENPWLSRYKSFTNDIWTVGHMDGDQLVDTIINRYSGGEVVVWIRNSMLGYRLSKRYQSANVCYIDNLHMDTPTDNLGFEKTSAPFAQFLYKRVVVSGRLERMIPNSILIPPPIDTDFWRCGTSVVSTRTRTVLFVGRFVPQKRPDLFVKVCARLPFGFQCVMIGSTAGSIGTVSAGKVQVQVKPWTDSKKTLCEYYCSSAALVLPSENEGVPIVALEARACGLRVVARRGVGAVAEVPGIILCDGGSEDELVDCMARMVSMESVDVTENGNDVYSTRQFRHDLLKVLG